MFATRLNVHGLQILVESYDSRVKTDLDHDFAYFVCTDFIKPQGEFFHLKILPKKERPRFWVPLFKTKRSILFASPLSVRRVCFFESTWLEYSMREKTCTLFSDDPNSAYESVYFVMLSYIGEQLDLNGKHRIHGMGFRYKGKGAILLAPSGGGKSTLAMELLKEGDFNLVSDDTPVLDSHGKMLAFPQRIALNEKPKVEEKYLRKFKRFNYSEKYVVGAEFFNEKIVDTSDIEWLILLDSSDGKNADVEEVSRLKFIWPLMKWLVIGYEIPQIWELYLRSGKTEIKNQIKTVLGRVKTAGILLAKSRVAVLKRGKDPKETRDSLSKFLSFNISRHI